MGEFVVNIDRAVKLKIIYPIGVKETITFTYNEITTLSDVFEVLISRGKNDRDVFITVAEGAALSRATNVLTWILEFNYATLDEGSYHFEIRNTTQDYIEFSGELKCITTINNE